MQQALPFILLIVGLLILYFVIIAIRLKFNVKVEKADVPGQIQAIVDIVLPEDNRAYRVVPAISKTSTVTMVKDTLKDGILTRLTGHRVFTYKPQEKFVLIYGNLEMYFVPIVENMTKKEIKPVLKQVSQISVEDLLKVKNNASGSSITLQLENKDKFLFGIMNEFFFPKLSAKAEKENFLKFVEDLKNQLGK